MRRSATACAGASRRSCWSPACAPGVGSCPSPADCAAREAWEEAGVCGTVGHEPIGAFSYTKQGTLRRLPCLALVFALQVDRLDDDYPEVRRRKRRWFRRKTAAAAVRSPDLAQMLRDFDPRGQRR